MSRVSSTTSQAIPGMVSARIMLLSLFCISTFVFGAVPSEAGQNSRKTSSLLREYAEQVIPELPEHVRTTLDRIPDFSRRMLALSYYIRRWKELENGWSWTAEEVSAFKLTDEYARMLVEIEKVKREFAESNPGYSLAVNVQARSLGSQIRKWNTVASVRRAAGDFIDSCSRLFEDTLLFPTHPDSPSVSRFHDFLQTYGPREGRVPTVAVPGLSKHGQLRAFDFKVKKGRRLIAGASSRTIQSRWERPGWTDKLREAIFTVSDRFEGPLDVPYEPWHYNYLLDKEVADTSAARR